MLKEKEQQIYSFLTPKETPHSLGDSRRLTMLFDFYEITMANGFFIKKKHEEVGVFDLFFRNIPDKGGYAIAVGLSQVIQYIQNLHFEKNDIQFLRSKRMFSEDFLDYFTDFKFTCDVYSVREGTLIFPNEPMITVVGPLIQAQILETMLLLCMNHQSLIATKSSRIIRAANGKSVMEFGSRRAQGCDAAIYGARAAFIGGCHFTSCAYADLCFKVPAIGTMAHSWIQSFDSEYEAFKAYAEVYPDNCVLLIDTYETLKSGLVNAIKVFKEIIVPKGYKPKGIRIDSGDLAFLSKECRKILDENGFYDTQIIVSNSLDEYVIEELAKQGACIDCYGVGERLITAKSEPVFGGVYKLVAIKKENSFIPKIKISSSPGKITNPGFKKIVRCYDRKNDMAICDILYLKDEFVDTKLIDLGFGEKYSDYYTQEIMIPIFKEGVLVYKEEPIESIQSFVQDQLKKIKPDLLNLDRVQCPYPVLLSENLLKLKNKLIEGKNKA